MRHGHVLNFTKRIVFVFVLTGIMLLTACEKKAAVTPAQPQTAETKTPAAAVKQAAPAAEKPVSPSPAAQAARPAGAGNPIVIMKTSRGEIHIELYRDKAPATVENFLTYVKNGHYNGTIFHRVIPGFMIQGGGMAPDMTAKATLPPIKNEAQNGLKNDRGTIAMARTNAPNSATCQFFINVANNAMLNAAPGRAGYAVFGSVTAGMDAADAIVKVPTHNVGMNANVPIEPIVIESVTCN
jgi:peptidyl-prolyl cis-trans isomerase A (cyclophilin A)